MKKIIIAAAGLVLMGAVAQAQVTQVLSRNAVGYVKVDVLSNNLVLAAIPFNAFSNTIPAIFGSQLTGGSNPGVSDKILKFDPVTKQYITFWKNLSGQWRQFPQTTETTNTLKLGEGFFIQNIRATNQSVYLMGEVPDSITAPTYTVSLVTNLSMASYSYPVEIQITNLAVKSVARKGTNPGVSDQLLAYDPVTKAYITFWFPSSGDQQPRQFPQTSATTNKLVPGMGFFYKRLAATTNWAEVKPYTWP
jgi:hypothetical protein